MVGAFALTPFAVQAAPIPTHGPRPRHVVAQAAPQAVAPPAARSEAKAKQTKPAPKPATKAKPVGPQTAQPRHKVAKQPPADTPTLSRTAHQRVAPPAALPALYRRGRRIRLRMPPPLKGSREILVHQNRMADEEGLERLGDDADLERLRGTGQLVSFPEGPSLRVNPELPANRRVARAWTVRFATEAGRAFRARFGQPLEVNSAARTVEYQLRLQQSNGNAAAVDGDAASPHLTGQAIDVGKRGMSAAQLAWMRSYLKPLMLTGKIDVEEEFQQACFHISVYRSYLVNSPRPRPARNEVAQLRGGPAGR